MSDQTEATPLTSAKIFQKMPEVFRPDQADGVTAIYEFDLSGEGGGRWHVVVENRTCTINQECAADPTVIFKMSSADHVGIVEGTVNPQMAFMTGRIKVEGDLGAALMFYQFFPSR